MSLLAADTFNRANGALGNTNGTGSLDPIAWSVTSTGTETVNVNTNRALGSSGTGRAFPQLAIAQADVNLRGRIPTAPSGTAVAGLMSRYVSTSVYTSLEYSGNVNFRFNPIGNVNTSVVPANGDILQLASVGVIHKPWINDRLIHIAARSANTSQTQHGMTFTGAATLDDFYCYTGAAVNQNTGWQVGPVGLGLGADINLPSDNPVILVSDTFNRTGALGGTTTDGPGTLGALTWSATRGTWTTTAANNGPNCTVLSTSWGVAGVNTGVSDGEIYCDVGSTGSGFGGLAFRIVDSSNFWVFDWSGSGGAARLRKMVAGVASTVATSANTGAWAFTRLVFNGSSISAYRGGQVTPEVTATDSAHSTATTHGAGTEQALSPTCTGWVFTTLRR